MQQTPPLQPLLHPYLTRIAMETAVALSFLKVHLLSLVNILLSDGLFGRGVELLYWLKGMDASARLAIAVVGVDITCLRRKEKKYFYMVW